MTGDKKTRSAESSAPTAKVLIEWRRVTFYSMIALAIVCVAHGATLWNPFVYLDFYNLAPLRDVSTSETFWVDTFYTCFLSPLSQPLVQYSYAIDMLSGTIQSPAVFHAMNIILHMCNCVLLLLLTFKLAGRLKIEGRLAADPYVIAGAAAMLFACHPMTCEAVAYVSARSALLVTFYYFAALLAFLKGFFADEIKDALIGYGFCYTFVILAVLSNPQGITIPAAMLLVAVLFKPAAQNVKSWVGDRPFEYFALLLVALVLPLVSLLKYVAPIGNGFGLEALPLSAYLATQCKTLLTYYLRCTIAPFGLSLDPPMTVATGFTDPLALLGAVIPVSAVVLAYIKRNSPLISFALCLFVLGLLPDFIVAQPEVLSDRRFYLPLAAICMMAGLLFATVLEKRGKAVVIAGVVLLAGMVGLTNWRDQAWKSDMVLWQAAYDMNSGSDRSKAMRIWAMSVSGKAEDASKVALEELKTNPNKAVLNLVLGQWSLLVKDYPNAARFFKAGLELAAKQSLSPEIIWQMQSGLAQSSMLTGDMETAKKYAEEAVRVQPNSPRLHLILGKYYLSKDQPQQAFQELQKSYVLDRFNGEILEPLAISAIACGEREHQELGYQIAKRASIVTPGHDAMLLHAYAALETGRIHEAVLLADRYMKMGKPKPEIYWILHGAFKVLSKTDSKQTKLAEDYRKKALELDPDLPKKMRLYLNAPIKIPVVNKKAGEKDEKGKAGAAPSSSSAPGSAPSSTPGSAPSSTPSSAPSSTPAPTTPTQPPAPTSKPAGKP